MRSAGNSNFLFFFLFFLLKREREREREREKSMHRDDSVLPYHSLYELSGSKRRNMNKKKQNDEQSTTAAAAAAVEEEKEKKKVSSPYLYQLPSRPRLLVVCKGGSKSSIRSQLFSFQRTLSSDRAFQEKSAVGVFIRSLTRSTAPSFKAAAAAPADRSIGGEARRWISRHAAFARSPSSRQTQDKHTPYTLDSMHQLFSLPHRTDPNPTGPRAGAAARQRCHRRSDDSGDLHHATLAHACSRCYVETLGTGKRGGRNRCMNRFRLGN